MAKKITIKNEQELNDAIKAFLTRIASTGASSRGNDFDATVRNYLLEEVGLTEVNLITPAKWKENIFTEYRKLSLSKKFDFTKLAQINYNGVELNLMVIDKPNGSQNWPDLLIVYNQVGLPLEVKSSDKDKIVWNSGYPRLESLYIFNCYGKTRTTFFLGEHAINEEELSELRTYSNNARANNKDCSGKRWSYYVRNMFNSNQTYMEPTNFDGDALKKEIEKNQSLINSDAISEEEKADLEDKIKHQSSSDEYRQYQARMQRESEVMDFINNLPWNPSQHTDFSD